MKKINEILCNSRVCPKPMIWNDVWKLIDNATTENISKPMILAAWNFSSDIEKHTRFKYHLTKAVELNLLVEVMNIIGEKESNWHHYDK